MHKIWRQLVLVFIVGLFWSSCSLLSEDSPKMENHFKVNDKEYKLFSGVVFFGGPYYGNIAEPFTEGYVAYIGLLSELVYYDGRNDFRGAGQVIEIGFNSRENGKIPDGVYEIDDRFPFNAGKAGFASYDISFVQDKFNSDSYSEIITGSVTIKNTSVGYEITLNLMDDNARKITGYYKGSLKEIEFD